MRDLAARLRAIVKANPPAGAVRDLTYVPDPDLDGCSPAVDVVAARLGGTTRRASDSACVVLDRGWESDRWYGRRQVESYAIAAAAPIALFDPRLTTLADWASRVVFFDVETTGLSGGAGTLAFLAGCGWFERGAFRVRQFLLAGPGGERAMLAALRELFDEASLVVTFNGRTFDLPVMAMRWAFHREESPTEGLAHFDMLPPARRLWGQRGEGACSLTALERSVLGFQRESDVAGFEIPARYFQFLRTGETTLLEGVLEHNRHDLLSLAAITAHAFRLAQEGPAACREPGEQVALGRLYERAGDAARALRAYECAVASAEGDLRGYALARLARLLGREDRHEESAAAWQSVLDLAAQVERPFARLERRAAEALAIHYEHRAKEPARARPFAELLRPDGGDGLSQARAADVAHRLSRLDRKIGAARAKGGPAAAPRLID